MFKSNMTEEEIEEILGTLKVDKERFLLVREKVNSKLKKLKKILLGLNIYDSNVKELDQWLESSQDILSQYQDIFTPKECDKEVSQEYLENFQVRNPIK